MPTPSGFPTSQDLINAQKDVEHLGRVVNSEDAQGNPIASSTNRTGGVNKTLDALQAEYQSAIQAAGGVPLGTWASGVTYNAYNEYLVYNGIPYKPAASTTLPYTTQGADPTASPDAGLVVPFVEVVASDLVIVREDLLGPGTQLYMGDDGDTVKVSDVVPAGTTHLRVDISGSPTLVTMSPTASGSVALLSGTGATIGGVAVDFYVFNDVLNFSNVQSMKDYQQHVVNSRVSTGFTSWKIVDKTTDYPTQTSGLHALPLNGLCFFDYGAAGDYFLDDGSVNPSPTDDYNAIQSALDDTKNGRTISGVGAAYYHSDTIKIDTNKKVRDAYFKQASGVTTPAVWFGDSINESPGNYEGRDIEGINLTFDPNTDCPVVSRWRGLQNCYFRNVRVEPMTATASTGQLYALIDGIVGTKYEKCVIEPKDDTSTILNIGLMQNLSNTGSAGNGLGATSSTFSTCNLRRALRFGDILGDSITFNEQTIFEFTEDGWIVKETGSLVEFNDCYWENINNYKIYVRGVDSRNPATHVRVIGGKVQQGDNNGSEPNRAFFKVEHGYNVEMNGTIFQGRPQVRLVEFVSGGNGFIDGRVSINANYGQNPRKEQGSRVGSVTVSSGSNTIEVSKTNHGLVSGDVIDVISTNQGDPIDGVTFKLPNRVITKINDDTFSYNGFGSAASNIIAEINYETYKSSSNCLANQDAPSNFVSEAGESRRIGANLYDFSDCKTEFVTFTFEASGNVNEQIMRVNGRESWSADSVAYIKSVKYIDDAGVDSSRFGRLRYGGKKYSVSNVVSVNNEKADFASTTKYIAPYKIEPGEPVTAYCWTGNGTYPRTLSIVVEVALTGLTYVKDQ